uniref:Uncharacterized protein n=1 Tax=Parastrongyloides trichosuri TaxID=131310 RepID=A0A0N4Z5A1_PARTI
MLSNGCYLKPVISNTDYYLRFPILNKIQNSYTSNNYKRDNSNTIVIPLLKENKLIFDNVFLTVVDNFVNKVKATDHALWSRLGPVLGK